MVKASEFITSKYLTAKNAGEYKGKSFVIDSVFKDTINEQDKLCIRFKGIDNPLPLNQTNLTIMSMAYGDDTDAWVNKSAIIHIVKVSYNGQMVDGIQLEAKN